MKKTPGLATVPQVLATFAATFVAIIVIGVVIARTGLPFDVAILATPGATLLVALAAIRLFRLNPYRALRLRPAKNSHLLLSIPVALSLFVVSDQLANLSRAFLPIDEQLVQTVAELVRADGLFSWLIRLAGIGFGAALAEELLFRGVILTGLRPLGRGGALVVSALLFTVMHGLLLPNYFVAGIVLGLAAMATRSILVPISIHLVHNVAALLLFNLTDIETLGDPLWIPGGILVPAAAILGIGVFVYLRDLGEERDEAPAVPAPERPDDVWLPSPPPDTPGIGEDLRDVPSNSRRLGFVFLALSLIGGLLIAVVLFVYLGYLTNPGPQRAAAIQQLRQIAHESLAEEAADREAEIDAAFETLTELNREGRVGLRHVWRAATVVATATTDGEFGSGDVESLLMAVGGIRQDAEERRPRQEPRAPGRAPGDRAGQSDR
jgi:membrane protease YdiL (CAAX protease family)